MGAAAGGAGMTETLNLLEQGDYPPCVGRILAERDSLAVCSDLVEGNSGCPARSQQGEGEGLISRLEYEGKVYGVVAVYVARDFVPDYEEQDLFRELAGDIAYALASMEKEAVRLKAQEDLERSEEKLRLMFESMAE